MSSRNNSRRRRVILEDAVQQTGGIELAESALASRKHAVDLKNSYGQAAKRRGQMKTTDLIPKRPLPIALVFAAAVFGVVLINLLAIYSQGWSEASADAIRAFGLVGVGTISAWFSSMLLLITGMASLQIYGMRKHRFDDYSGHYRVWLFLAALFLFASANCVIDFKSALDLVVSSLGFVGEQNLVLLLLAKLVALTALVIRGVLEIRASRAAFSAVVCVWIAYACAIVLQIPAVKNELVQNDEIIFGNAILVGNVALFATVVVYARFVYLHANSMIKLSSEKENKHSISQAKPDKALAVTPKRNSGPESESVQASVEPGIREAERSIEESDSILRMHESEEQNSCVRSRKSKKRNKKAQKSQRRAA